MKKAKRATEPTVGLTVRIDPQIKQLIEQFTLNPQVFSKYRFAAAALGYAAEHASSERALPLADPLYA